MRPIRVFCLLLALCLSASAAAVAETQQVFAHLFTVPTSLPEGGDVAAQTTALQAWLAETFGGYTRFGPGEGGWKNESAAIETEANVTYIVTAPRDVSKDIAARLARDFAVRVPYVLVFPAALCVK